MGLASLMRRDELQRVPLDKLHLLDRHRFGIRSTHRKRAARRARVDEHDGQRWRQRNRHFASKYRTNLATTLRRGQQ
jgi:hypothetical protein